MSNFRTIVPIKPVEKRLSYEDNYFLMGSCFSENIGHYLKTYQFKQMVNPFGIIFNLASLSRLTQRIVDLEHFTTADIVENQGVWSCFEAHSNQNSQSSQLLLERLNQQLTAANDWLKNATIFVLTVGTSWVYRHLAYNKIVANCHKMPANHFEKVLLNPAENLFYLNQIILKLKAFNPNLKIMLTVSPVRHIKDGFFENNVSKAHLLSAIYQVNETNVFYFPSYEIMQDDLRDYRFYAEDMLHPNEIAIKYIWQKFSDNYFDASTIQTMTTVEAINKMKQHRPFIENSAAHLEFLKDLDQKVKRMQSKYIWFFRNH
jgi:hypothetical protein